MQARSPVPKGLYSPGGRALTRSFKPVSNRFTREWIEAHLPDGLDGELLVPGVSFSETSGHIGRHEGEPDFQFHVFDYVSHGTDEQYTQRMDALCRLSLPPRVLSVLPKRIGNVAELEALQGARFVAGNKVTPLIDGPASFAKRDPMRPVCSIRTREQAWRCPC